MTRETTAGSGLKSFIKGIPVLGSTAGKLAQLPIVARVRSLAFPGSASFWESVYRNGGTSGPGSYGRLAQFKAEVLNNFVRSENVRKVIEFGCGDGSQLELASYPEYIGVDIAAGSIERCSSRFASDPTKRFFLTSDLPKDIGTFDLAISLDVIYHLVEDRVFEQYMRSLFGYAERHAVIYSSNRDAVTPAVHVRHRKFTDWIDKNASEWRPSGFVPNPFPFDPDRPEETSCADFYLFTRQVPDGAFRSEAVSTSKKV